MQARLRALVMAADYQRLAVIDELLAARTPIDATDAVWGRQALPVAATNGRIASVEHLLARGADPDDRDLEHCRTVLEWCIQARDNCHVRSSHNAIEAILRPLTTTD